MKKYILLGIIISYIFLAVFLIIPFLLHPLYAGEKPDYVEGEIIIEFEKGKVPESEARAIAKELGCEVIKKLGRLDIYHLKIPHGKNVLDYAGKAKKHIKIKNAYPNYYAHPAYTPYSLPNDTYYQSGVLWPIPITQTDKAWNTPAMMPWAKGLTSTVVAVIDSGINSSHVDLMDKIVPGWNVISNSSDTTDIHGHGTEISGLLGAEVNNSTGIAGMAWNCLIMPVKITTNWTDATAANAIAGIDWASQHGAQVFNCSWGFVSASGVDTAISNAYSTDHHIAMAASGDSGTYELIYPASDGIAFAIAASGSHDEWATYSTYSSYVICAAPGGDLTTEIGGPSAYANWGGTSMSCPYVCALAAVLMSNGVSYDEVSTRITKTADKVDAADHAYDANGWNQYLGYGRINFYNAMGTLVPPSGLVATITCPSTVSLTWSAPPISTFGISGYNVYRSTTEGTGYAQINGSLVGGTTYTDSTATNACTSTFYYYTVKGLDNQGFLTKYSGESTAGPTFTNTYTFTSTYTPTNTPTPLPASFTLAKSSNVPKANQGDQVTWTLSCQNRGGPAQNVLIWDTLPNTMTFVSADSGYSVLGPGLYSWTIANVNPNSTVSKNLVAKVNSNDPTGVFISNTFSMSYNDILSQITPYSPLTSNKALVSIGSLVVYPNPFRVKTALNHELKFANIPAGSTIEIRTMSALLVKSIATSTTYAAWDGTNDNGQAVAPGVYFYLVSGGGQTSRGTIVLIR